MPQASADRGTTGDRALLVDVACVRGVLHDRQAQPRRGDHRRGVAETAWPFLTGTAVGWLAARAWRQPAALAPTGLTIWLCTVVIGMLLRKATSAGTAVSFVVVASLVTAILLLGWRAAVAALARR